MDLMYVSMLMLILLITIIGVVGYPLLPPNQYASLLADQSIDHSREKQVILQAIHDYKGSVKHGDRLLCGTFMKASLSPFPVLRANVLLLKGICDWAVVLYDADSIAHVKSICKMIIEPMMPVENTLVYCGQSPLSLMNRTTSVKVRFASNVYDYVVLNSTLPKSVQYSQLLPYLKSYDRVFLLDEDVSVEGLNMTRLQQVWNCAFWPQPPPLLVQPLIAESTQLFEYVNKRAWITGGRDTVIASSVGLVEQQVPLIDARFFEWFISRVLTMTRDIAIKMGVDQGLDKTWCNAAKVYGKKVLNYTREFSPCALINSEAVHHLNTQSMKEKRANLQAFKEKAKVVLSRYKDLFPNWVLTDSRYFPHPLSADYRHRYRTIFKLDQTCLALPR